MSERSERAMDAGKRSERTVGAGNHGHDSEPGVESDMKLDCTAMLADVWLMLDGECDHATRERLQHHLETCSPCIDAYGLEEKLKRLLNRKCGGDRAPDGLRERLTVDIRRSITITETRVDP